jgi:hypothetical protein
MARSDRIVRLVAAPLVLATVIAAAAPARAQFINPFEALFGPPPRPPGSVPGARQPPGPPQAYPQHQDPRYYEPRYPDQRYQDPRYQEQAPRGGGVESQSLPPPPGGTTAAVPPQPLGPGGQRPRAPGEAAPPPSVETLVEPPAQRIPNRNALFSGLDKITGRIINFDTAIGETVQFGALQVTTRVCYTRPPTESANTDAFIEVDEVTLQGEIKRIFTGWMFASSPGLHAVEHPIYDVWLTDCRNPLVPVAAPVEATPAPPPPPRPTTPRRPPQQGGQGSATRR